VIGFQVPEPIALRIYEMFASQAVSQTVHELDQTNKPATEVQCAMNLEDLITFYNSFKNQADFDQIAWWLLKTKTTRRHFIEVEKGLKTQANEVDNPYLLYSGDMKKYFQRLCKMSQQQVDEIYNKFSSLQIPLSNDSPVS